MFPRLTELPRLSRARWVVLAAWGLALLSVPRAAGAGSALQRHHVDAQEMQNERALRPEVATLIERGEASLAASHFSEAAELFQAAVDGSPHSALPRRRLCVALVALGRRTEAIQACQSAASNLGSAMDFRALVGALVSEPPTPSQLAAALADASRATQVMNHEPWGYAAQCDIMRRLGDLDMLSKCFQDLQRVAPDHYETRRVGALVTSLRSLTSFALAWAALGLLVMGTAFHALRHRWLARRGSTLAMLVIAAIWATGTPARAAEPGEAPTAGGLSKYKINPADPSASVPGPAERDANPLEYGYFLMDLADQAAKSTEAGDHAGAARYWMALHKAVPDRSVSLTKACESYEAAGDWQHAITSCKLALEKGGLVVGDFARFVTVSLKRPTALDSAELADIDKVFKHLETLGTDHAVIDELNCNVALKQNDTTRLEQCSANLAARIPDNPQTIYYQWALAVLKGDPATARKFITRAKFVGSSAARIEQMERATAVTNTFWVRVCRPPVLAAMGVLFLSGLAFALTRALRGRAAPQIAQS